MSSILLNTLFVGHATCCCFHATTALGVPGFSSSATVRRTRQNGPEETCGNVRLRGQSLNILLDKQYIYMCSCFFLLRCLGDNVLFFSLVLDVCFLLSSRSFIYSTPSDPSYPSSFDSLRSRLTRVDSALSPESLEQSDLQPSELVSEFFQTPTSCQNRHQASSSIIKPLQPLFFEPF